MAYLSSSINDIQNVSSKYNLENCGLLHTIKELLSLNCGAAACHSYYEKLSCYLCVLAPPRNIANYLITMALGRSQVNYLVP